MSPSNKFKKASVWAATLWISRPQKTGIIMSLPIVWVCNVSSKYYFSLPMLTRKHRLPPQRKSEHHVPCRQSPKVLSLEDFLRDVPSLMPKYESAQTNYYCQFSARVTWALVLTIVDPQFTSLACVTSFFRWLVWTRDPLHQLVSNFSSIDWFRYQISASWVGQFD